MLLDEPTSNLDSLNEAVILRAAAHQRKGQPYRGAGHPTARSTMGIADTVYSVEKGRVS